MDPLQSMVEESGAETGPGIGPDGQATIDQPAGPSFGQRLGSLFLPCPDDPLSYEGGISRFINKRLGERAGVEPGAVFVGQNVAHCIEHVFPGGGSIGWPPIVNLVRSIMDYREKAAREVAPDAPPVAGR